MNGNRCIVVCSDVLDYFEIGNERIDMDKWRREKLHDKDLTNKSHKHDHAKITRFVYYNTTKATKS